MAPLLKTALPLLLVLPAFAGAGKGWNLRKGPDGVERCYAPQRTLELPYKVLESSVAPLKTLRLFVSRDAGRTWTEALDYAPGGPLRFEAPEDGEYGFSLVGADSAGNALPAPAEGELPQLTVVVDTRPPQVTCEARGEARPGAEITLAWDGRDEAGMDGVRVEASLDAGTHWIVAAQGEGRGEAAWALPAEATEAVLLRAVGRDLAGHRSHSQVLRIPVSGPVPPPPPAPPPPPPPPPPPVVEPVPEPKPEPEPEKRDWNLAEAQAHFRRAGILRLSGHLAEAEAEYRLAVQAHPGLASARNDLGILLYKHGKADEGLAHLWEAHRVAPEDADVAFNLGYALFECGRPAEAMGPLGVAAATGGGEPRYYFALSLDGAGLRKEALQALKGAEELEEPWASRCRDLGKRLRRAP